MTLVFVHGAGCTAAVFDNQVSAFRDEALAITLPGHTTPGAPTSIDEFTDALESTLNQRDLHDVVLCGSSMGGAIGLTYALRNTGRLRALVLLGSASRLRVAPAILLGLERDFEQTVSTLSGYFYADATPKRIEWSSAMMREVGQAQTLRDFQACDAFDCTEVVSRLDLPLLVLTGERDVMTPPKVAIALGDRVVGSTVRILPEAGHLAMLERPHDTNEALRSFVASI